ncbi:MAG: transglycosylase SLT domain-containing protein [Candidatus Woesearchaeota archaeon]
MKSNKQSQGKGIIRATLATIGILSTIHLCSKIPPEELKRKMNESYEWFLDRGSKIVAPFSEKLDKTYDQIKKHFEKANQDFKNFINELLEKFFHDKKLFPEIKEPNEPLSKTYTLEDIANNSQESSLLKKYFIQTSDVEEFQKKYSIFLGDYFLDEVKWLYEEVKSYEKRLLGYEKGIDLRMRLLNQYYDHIFKKCVQYNIPLPAAIGIMLYETDGTIKSVNKQSNDKGIYQISLSTAWLMGMKVTNDVEERFHPEKSIDSALQYLRRLNNRLYRWDLTVLAYHLGENKVKRMISTHLKTFYKENINPENINAEIIKKYDIKLIDLIKDLTLQETYPEFKNSGKKYIIGCISWHEIIPRYLEKKYEKTIYSHYFLEKPTSWEELSKKYGIDSHILKEHNPHILNKQKVPAETYLKVPIEKVKVSLKEQIESSEKEYSEAIKNNYIY